MLDLQGPPHGISTKTTMGFFRKPRPAPQWGDMRGFLERQTYFPGDEIHGLVGLRVDLQVVDATLTVELRGQERVTTALTDIDTTKCARQFTHTLLSHEFDLGRMCLGRGRLDVPFSIFLPNNLAPSDVVRFGPLNSGTVADLTITYEVICKLIIHQPGFGVVTQTVPFTVLATPLARRIGEPVAESRRQVFHYGLFKKSSCEVNVRLDSDVYTPNSLIRASIMLELAMLYRFKWVRVSLFRYIKPLVKKMPSYPKGDYDMVCTTVIDKSIFVDFRSFTVVLPVTPGLLQDPDPLKASIDYFHFRVCYEVVVKVKIKSCSVIAIRIPVTIVQAQQPVVLRPPRSVAPFA